MVKIASAIREGANAYLKRQFAAVIKFFIVVFIALCAFAFVPPLLGDGFRNADGSFNYSAGLVNVFTPFAFITGGFFTGLSGYIGMKAATRANARTAYAAEESLNKGLRVSFSAGSVMGFIVVGLGLFDISAWILVLRFVFGIDDPVVIGETMVKFAIGVCSMAMFSRIGGGIFTKAADVGADLVGKVEANIPEDDPRNPAVIADNVGDNVGDVAGMGADLYETYAGSILGSFALGVGIYGWAGMLLPIFLVTVGIVSSLIGTFFVRTKENASQKALLHSLHRGTFVAAGLIAVMALPITFFVANLDSTPQLMKDNAWGLIGSIILGIAAGLLTAYFSEYYTSDNYKPPNKVAESSKYGPATVIIGGVSLGMEATVGPIVTVAVATLGSFFLSGGGESSYAGLYGVGIAAVGLLATLGINLSADAFGPVADNAGGIAQMAHMSPEVRERTDALDALGNTTAATGKGFSISATAFTALVLLVSFVNLAENRINAALIRELGHADARLSGLWQTLNIALDSPPVLIGVFIGAVSAFFFGALCMSAVGKAAESVVEEVRRQFREIAGLMEGKEGVRAQYDRCVDLCTRNALRKMVAPSLLAFLMPIVVGVILGASGVAGFLVGIIVTGFSLALFMLLAGGAWDNAKKYIEHGNFNGKGSDNHKAAIIGDTVGDPFKDTAGPSYNILITLSSIVAIVFVALTDYSLIGRLF